MGLSCIYECDMESNLGIRSFCLSYRERMVSDVDESEIFMSINCCFIRRIENANWFFF